MINVLIFGCENLFSLVSHQACQLEEVNFQFKSLDTTSHSLTGEYAVDEEGCDENIIRITHGHSKAHRPDLKQVVQETIVSQDGGIPLACKNWDGNIADTAAFKARSKALVDSFKSSKTLSYLIADCKLYHKGNAEFLSQLQFITLIPSTIKREKELISSKLSENKWHVIDDNYQYSVEHVNHMEIEQRWIIIHSKTAQGRSEKSVIRQVARAKAVLDKSLFHLQAQRFSCEHDVKKALKDINKKLKYHLVEASSLTEHKVYEGKGRPPKGVESKSIEWQITGKYEENPEAIKYARDQKSCFILATNISGSALSPEEILKHYKAQSAVERGFRFLKDPYFLFHHFLSRNRAELMLC